MADPSLPADNSQQPAPSAPDLDRSPQQSGETSAPSPRAPSEEKGETRETLLQAVEKAVPELRTSPSDQRDASGVAPALSRQDQAASSQQQPPRDELPEEVTAEELARYHPSAKRRVEKLIDQRRDLRTEVDRLKAIEPRAQAADQVSKYLKDNDIAREDFLLTLELAAAMRRGDFRSFYEGVKPYVQLAEQYLGISLPADLHQQVQQGQMTPQAAALFSRERMDRAMSDTQRLRQAQIMDQRDAATNQQSLQTAVRDRVNAWEQATKQQDPDYGMKQAAIGEVMWSVVREKGAPQSPEAAVEIAKEAYRRVNDHYRSWTPPKRPTSRTPSSIGRTNGAAPEPRNLKEAVEQAMEKARANI